MRADVGKTEGAGFRITHQRRWRCWRCSPPAGVARSVEAVYDDQVRARYPTVSLATIYKTIGVLKELGEVLERASPTGAVITTATGRTRATLICTRCGAIADPDLGYLHDLTRKSPTKPVFRI